MTAFGPEPHESVDVPPDCGPLLCLSPILALVEVDSEISERLPTAPCGVTQIDGKGSVPGSMGCSVVSDPPPAATASHISR